MGVFTLFGGFRGLMNAGFSETPLIVIFTNSIKTSLSLSLPFQKEPFFFFFFACPPSPVFLHVVISLRLPMVFNSSFMPGAFYKLYSHGLLARPPTESACLNSICLRPRHIERAQDGPRPASFGSPFCPPATRGWEWGQRRCSPAGWEIGVWAWKPSIPQMDGQISPSRADALLATGAYLKLIPNALPSEFYLAF